MPARTTALVVPDPQTRVSAAMYAELRTWLLENDPDAQAMLDWSNNELLPPESPEKMAGEIIWIILCAGRWALGPGSTYHREKGLGRDRGGQAGGGGLRLPGQGGGHRACME